MANNHGISTFLETELGEAFDSIIDPTGYGSATFIVKEFMEKHKDEMIGFWNRQGKDGKTIFDRWYVKWSMTKAEQAEAKVKKELEKHNKTVNQYVALGETKESAENLASLFPDSDPLDILRGKNYNTQNKPLEEKQEAKEAKLEAEKQAKEAEANLKQLAGSTLEGLEEIKNLLNISIDNKAKLVIAKPKTSDSNTFSQVAQVIRRLNGKYVSAGRDSHFEIPIEAKMEQAPQQQAEPQQAPHP